MLAPLVNLLALILNLVRANDVVDSLLSDLLNVFGVELHLIFEVSHLVSKVVTEARLSDQSSPESLSLLVESITGDE